MVYLLKIKMASSSSIFSYICNSSEEPERIANNIKNCFYGSNIFYNGSTLYRIILNRVEVCNIEVYPFNKKDIEIHLLKTINGEWQETRRFSTRENAVKFVHHVLDSDGFEASADEDNDGMWSYRNDSNDEIKYVMFLAIYKTINKAKKNDCFEVLGVKPNATNEEIKKAYHQKSKIHHPDMGGNMQDFLKIQEAYEDAIEGVKYGNENVLHRELYEFYQYIDIDKIVSDNQDIVKKSNYNPSSDFLKGFVLFAIGGILSWGSYNVAHSNGGGRYTIYTGLIFYGLFRVFRSILRGVFGDRAITEAKIKAKKIMHNTIIYGGITIIIVLLMIFLIALIFRSF